MVKNYLRNNATAPNSTLPVQSQNQPAQSEENCYQRAWRWIAETASSIWEAVMGFFRRLCCCNQPSNQQSSAMAQASSQATTSRVTLSTATTVSAPEPAPSAPPQAQTLPVGTVYFNPNASAERALKDQIGRQLWHPTVERRGFTDMMDREVINDTFYRMQNLQGRLQVDAGFDTTVGCLLSRYNGEPALFIVVPYRDGVVEFLRREFPFNGQYRDAPQWQIYTDGNRRFIGGYWQRLPYERTQTVALPPALVSHIPLEPSASSATTSSTNTTNAVPSPFPSAMGVVVLNTDQAARAALNEQLIQLSRHPSVNRRCMTSEREQHCANVAYERMRDVQSRLQGEGISSIVGCLLSTANQYGSVVPATYVVVPYREGIVDVLKRAAPNTADLGNAREGQWQVYTVGNMRFIASLWQYGTRESSRAHALPPPLTPYVALPLP